MLVVGLFAVLSWESTFPEKARRAGAGSLTRAGTDDVSCKDCSGRFSADPHRLFHCTVVAGVMWPIAFAVQATAQEAPALTFEPTPKPRLQPPGWNL